MIYCENIVNVTLFFFSPQISKPLFFSPIFGNAIVTIVTIFFFPISAMALPQLVCQFFFFSFHFGHFTHTSHTRAAELGKGISISTLPKFNIFSLPFSSSLSYFWLNFGNGNTEIQSRSSESQISFNSSYNAN